MPAILKSQKMLQNDQKMPFKEQGLKLKPCDLAKKFIAKKPRPQQDNSGKVTKTPIYKGRAFIILFVTLLLKLSYKVSLIF